MMAMYTIVGVRDVARHEREGSSTATQLRHNAQVEGY